MRRIIFLLVFMSGINCFAQDITNTLGNGGNYFIKDTSRTFFTLRQSDGYLGLGTTPNQQFEITGNFRLPPTATDSNSGIIYKGADSFIHDFQADGTVGKNTFVGISAGNFTMQYQGDPTNASFNTGIGSDALNALTSGYINTAVGGKALLLDTDGWGNTSVGYNSLIGLTTGNINTAIGVNAGTGMIDGSNCTIIGAGAQASSPSATNEVTLGKNITALRCDVTSITSLSDIRDKADVKDLTPGLNFLCSIKPRQFHWNKREWYEEKVWNKTHTSYKIIKHKNDGSKTRKEWTAGFIAQELDTAETKANVGWLNLVYKDNPNKWEATYGNLLPVIVKSIQQLKEQNDKLAAENANLKKQLAQISELDKQIAEVKKLKKELTKEINTVKSYTGSKNDETLTYKN